MDRMRRIEEENQKRNTGHCERNCVMGSSNRIPPGFFTEDMNSTRRGYLYGVLGYQQRSAGPYGPLSTTNPDAERGPGGVNMPCKFARPPNAATHGPYGNHPTMFNAHRNVERIAGGFDAPFRTDGLVPYTQHEVPQDDRFSAHKPRDSGENRGSRRQASRQANLLSATLSILKDLDSTSLQVVVHEAYCRIDELANE